MEGAGTSGARPFCFVRRRHERLHIAVVSSHRPHVVRPTRPIPARNLLACRDGYILPLTAIVIVPLLAVAALVFELGRAFLASQELEAAARAAAGVGAAYYSAPPSVRDGLVAAAAEANVRLSSLAPPAITPPSGFEDDVTKIVTVRLEASLPTVLSSILGRGSLALAATASAERVSCGDPSAPETCAWRLVVR